MLCKRGLCRHPMSVCLSLMFVNSIETNKHIFKIFSPPHHSSFSVQNCMAIFQR